MAIWLKKTIDVMHLAKDTMRGQYNQTQINTIINTLATFGPNGIALPIPLNDPADYPSPQPAAGYTEKWLIPIRANGLKVDWRGAFIDFEGIYDKPRATPTGTPSRALGVAANVIAGTDTTSYLALIAEWLRDHVDWLEAGDWFGPNPEPENQGVGAGTSNMFSSHAVLKQWLLDIKTVADHVLENELGFEHEEIITGMTSINGGTIEVGQVTNLSQNGRVNIDHYIPSGTYSASLDTIHTNAGVDEIYIGEYGTTGGVGAPATDLARSQMIDSDFSTFEAKEYIKGVCYWQAVGGSPTATERILDGENNFIPYPLSQGIIQSYFIEPEEPEPPEPPPPTPTPSNPEIFPQSSIPRYQILIRDKEGNTIGEVNNWFNLRFTGRHNNFGNCTFELPATSPDLTRLVSSRRYETLILRNGQIVWSGEQARRDGVLEANSPQMITITSYTFEEQLNHMLTQDFIRFDPEVDQGEILKQLVDYAQSLPSGNLGFTFAPIIPTQPRIREYARYEILTAFINMSNVIGGPDFWIDSDKVIHIVENRGSDLSKQVILEFGTNLLRARISEDFSSPINEAIVLGSGFGAEQQVGGYLDTETRDTYGLRRKVVSEIDVTDIENLNGKGQLLVNKNKTALVTINTTQLPNSKPQFGSISIGDTIGIRIREGIFNINTPFRIYGYEVTIGQNGEENVAYTIARSEEEAGII